MSEPTPPTDPNALLFPAFIHGTQATCRRKMKAEAKKWAKHYDKLGTFPEPVLVPVPQGSRIHCGDLAGSLFASVAPQVVGWYFYLVEMFRLEVSMSVSVAHKDKPMFRAAYEAFVRRYPWGGLSLATNSQQHNSIALVCQRLESVLSFWEQLDTVRFIDGHFKEVNLAQLMTYWTYDFMLAWADAPLGRPVREVLRETNERMRNASEDEIHARMMRRLHQVADTDPELQHRAWLKSPGVIEAELGRIKQTWPALLEDLKTDNMGAHAGFLSELEKKYPGS